jgi:Putative small multi-drug export protein
MTPSPQSIDLSGDAFAPLPRSARVALTVGPVGGFGLLLLATAVLVSPGAAGFVASMAVATFVGGGKLVILAGAVERAPVGPWELAGLIVYIDVATALVVLGGMHHLYRIPGVGRRFAAARETGWRVLRHNPWMYRVTWLSLAGFVAVPFQGTGALVGVVLGRLLGLSRRSIVIATALGSLVSAVALALAGDYWQAEITALAARPVLAFTMVVAVAGVTILGSYWLLGRAGSQD